MAAGSGGKRKRFGSSSAYASQGSRLIAGQVLKGRLANIWNQLFPVERHRIANLMIERIDIVHVGEFQRIKVKWRELGWDALIGEFALRGIGAEMLDLASA
jgi:hypothetical protein